MVAEKVFPPRRTTSSHKPTNHVFTASSSHEPTTHAFVWIASLRNASSLLESHLLSSIILYPNQCLWNHPPKMNGIHPHEDFVPSTAREPLNDSVEAGDSGYPAQNTRSKTPANAARAALAKASGAGKGRATRATIDLKETDETLEEDAPLSAQPGITAQKRPRTTTIARQAQEIEDRARLMRRRTLSHSWSRSQR
jgi:hypothetical protein